MMTISKCTQLTNYYYYALLCIVAVRLTPTNQVLLVVGVILLSVATIVGIVLIVVDVRTHKGNLVSLH